MWFHLSWLLLLASTIRSVVFIVKKERVRRNAFLIIAFLIITPFWFISMLEIKCTGTVYLIYEILVIAACLPYGILLTGDAIKGIRVSFGNIKKDVDNLRDTIKEIRK